jgi:transcription antitermination factor NusG
MAEKKWYVVHTYSGYEHKVKAALEERIRSMGKEEFFGDILVPAEKVVELVKGKRRTSSRKFFPGYILVNMALNDDTWHVGSRRRRSRDWAAQPIRRRSRRRRFVRSRSR